MANRCPLCFRLSSWLRELLVRFRGECQDCLARARQSYNAPDRLNQINSVGFDCACEQVRMSDHSICPVRDFERVDRTIFSPLFIDKKTGLLLPTIWDHVFAEGCSVQRGAMASNQEIAEFVTASLRAKPKWEWHGVASCTAGEIRSVVVGDDQRACCVYDTAEPDNIWHAEFGVSSRPWLDGDENEIRVHLDRIFGDGKFVKPDAYKEGAVKGAIPSDVAARVA